MLAIEIKKTQILVNGLFTNLGLSILYLSKTVIHDFLHDYVKPKYGENSKLCYMDIDTFIVYVKTDNIYKDTAEDFEIRYDNLSLEIDTPLPKEKKK